jgi:type I restriction enzyme M protein
MLTTEIKNKVQELWNRLWAGGLSNPITAIEQISYLLFMKRLENFHPKVPIDYKWSNYHKLEGEALVSHIKEKVFLFIKNELAEKGEPFAVAMQDTSFRITNPSLLEDSVKFIDAIYEEIEKQEKHNNQHFQDIQGDVYENLLKQTSEAGKNGQFRTPRHIIQLMAEMLDPNLDGKICDLACGSGGFLVGAYQYIITKNSKHKEIDENGLPKGIDGKKLTLAQRIKLKTNIFYGFDIDQTMVRICIMNLMMHGITKPEIVHLDALSEEYENFEGKDSAEKYKYIMANPPFTGKIHITGVSKNLDRIYPPKTDKDKKQVKRTVQSELLFIERIIYMLEEGGRATIIVPEGLLFSSGGAQIETRKLLMTDCNLKGVISLPEGAFQPYTAIKTSILIFEKRKFKSETPQDIDVWFYEMKSDGYSLDAKRIKLKDNPLPIVIEEWRQRESKSQKNRKLSHFAIPYAEIEKNRFELNFNLYRDFVYERQNYRNPAEILQQLSILEDEILRSLEELQRVKL